jgi:hypothetical protein
MWMTVPLVSLTGIYYNVGYGAQCCAVCMHSFSFMPGCPGHIPLLLSLTQTHFSISWIRVITSESTPLTQTTANVGWIHPQGCGKKFRRFLYTGPVQFATAEFVMEKHRVLLECSYYDDQW